MSVRRDTGAKEALAFADLSTSLAALLETIHHDMLSRARDVFDKSITTVTEWKDLVPALNRNHITALPWCENEQCEDEIKKRSAAESVEGAEDEKAPSAGAKSLCIPHDQSKFGSIEGKQCPNCAKPAKRWTLFGRSCQFPLPPIVRDCVLTLTLANRLSTERGEGKESVLQGFGGDVHFFFQSVSSATKKCILISFALFLFLFAAIQASMVLRVRVSAKKNPRACPACDLPGPPPRAI